MNTARPILLQAARVSGDFTDLCFLDTVCAFSYNPPMLSFDSPRRSENPFSRTCHGYCDQDHRPQDRQGLAEDHRELWRGCPIPHQIGRYQAFFGRHFEAYGGFDVEFKKFYFDTVLYNLEGIELLLKITGSDRCMFGTENLDTGSSRDPKGQDAGRPEAGHREHPRNHRAGQEERLRGRAQKGYSHISRCSSTP
jgi:hypothetical protein